MYTLVFMETTETHVFDDIEQVYQPAPTGKRFVNYIVDTIMYYLVFLACTALVSVVIYWQSSGDSKEIVESMDSSALGLLTYVFAFGIWVVFFTLTEAITKGRTLGKLITGTVAIREDGGNLTWKDALMRSLCRIIPFEAFSGFGGRPWHDTLTKTVVISK